MEISNNKIVKIKNNNGEVMNKKIKYIKYDNSFSDCHNLFNVYIKWKELCESLETMRKRTTNIPEAISECAVAILNGYVFINQKSITANGKKISTSFDCFDPNSGDKIQVKACSTEKDLTSFGPRSKFDKLIFVDFYNDGNRDGKFKVYDIPLNYIVSAHVNANQTTTEQANQSRRPRICIKKIISENEIKGIQYELTNDEIKKIEEFICQK